MMNNADTTDRQLSGKFKHLGLWLTAAFLVVSFICPFMITHKLASKTYRGGVKVTMEDTQRHIEDVRSESTRSGFIGLIVALAILLIWKVDRVAFPKDKDLTDAGTSTVILVCLAVLLWVCWTGMSYIVVKAQDEVLDVPPQLPGL